MTVDGITIITSYKEDGFGLTTTFINIEGEEEFCVKTSNPIARIKHILPVEVLWVFDGEKTSITGIRPF